MLDKNHFNPGSLEKCFTSSGKELLFKGQIANGSDKCYRQFMSIQYGYRALCRQIETDIEKGANTISKLISLYAPASDGNPTEQYVENVSLWSGINQEKVLDDSPITICKIAASISRQENGVIANMSEVAAGYALP